MSLVTDVTPFSTYGDACRAVFIQLEAFSPIKCPKYVKRLFVNRLFDRIKWILFVPSFFHVMSWMRSGT